MSHSESKGELVLSADNLTPKARDVIAALEAGKPFIFLTGKAGTGKSTLIRHVYERYREKAVLVAPTGVAALNIEGQTIHKFFRFPPRMFELGEIISRRTNPVVKGMELLIIDEISMVRADLLDHINMALKIWKQNTEPFGGVQILAVGDLFQLPPILGRDDEREIFEQMYSSVWFFKASVFKEVEMIGIELEKSYRQKDDKFIDVLDNFRKGRDLEDSVDWINAWCLKERFEIDSSLTLTATNKAADKYNREKFDSITEPLMTYRGDIDGDFHLKGQKLPAPLDLNLKVGAQVMIVKNTPSAENGTICRILDLSSNTIQVERLDDNRVFSVVRSEWKQIEYKLDPKRFIIETAVVGTYKQFPMMLGWAITVHKSQGLTLDSVLLDLGAGAFASGQAYVALSRCRSASKVGIVRPLQVRDFIIDEDALTFDESILDRN